MLLTAATIIAGWFGVKDILRIQRLMSIGVVIVAILAILIASVLFFRSCGGRKVKLDEKSILEAQTAVQARDEAKMREVLVRSDAAEAEATATASNATAVSVNAAKESRDRWANASADEMAKELEARAKQ